MTTQAQRKEAEEAKKAEEARKAEEAKQAAQNTGTPADPDSQGSGTSGDLPDDVKAAVDEAVVRALSAVNEKLEALSNTRVETRVYGTKPRKGFEPGKPAATDLFLVDGKAVTEVAPGQQAQVLATKGQPVSTSRATAIGNLD